MNTDTQGDQDRSKNDDKDRDKDNIQLEVATPNGVFRGEFDKTDKVSFVIKTVVEDRGLIEGDAFDLYYGDVHLTPENRPLVSFGLKGKVKLALVATGSGV